MRRTLISLFAAVLFALGIHGSALSDLTKEQRAQVDRAARVPIVGQDLRNATQTRFEGQCGTRQKWLSLATERLNFARALRAKNSPRAPSASDISRAQRALDAETRRRCVMSEEYRKLAVDLRDAPALTGTVSADENLIVGGQLNSELAPLAYVTARRTLRKNDASIKEIREALENIKKIRKHIKRERDAALNGLIDRDVNLLQQTYGELRDLEIRLSEQLERRRVEEYRKSKKKDENASDTGFGSEPISFPTVGEVDWDRLPPILAQDPPLTRTQQTWLDAHNQARRYWGVPDLDWDPYLAQSAQGWADEMARRNLARAQHSPREGREFERENLLTSLPGQRSAYQMVRVWVQERRYFIPGHYPNVSSTGDWYVVSHFTQVIWPYTTHVGCGVSVTVRVEFFVCRYSPPGNRDGVYIEPHNDRWERG